MKLLSQKLLSELQQRLDGIPSETTEPLEQVEQGIKASIAVLEKLKTKFISHQFKDKADEIDFFRNCKPQLASKLIYYNEVYTMLSTKPIGAKKQSETITKSNLISWNYFLMKILNSIVTTAPGTNP
jgi:hypothetical protein